MGAMRNPEYQRSHTAGLSVDHIPRRPETTTVGSRAQLSAAEIAANEAAIASAAARLSSMAPRGLSMFSVLDSAVGPQQLPTPLPALGIVGGVNARPPQPAVTGC